MGFDCQTDTGAVRTATSSEDGTYVLSNLPIGPYRLEVSRSGFTTYVQTGIVLQVATNLTINVSLQVGAVSEQIQVEANAALVETQNTSIGSVIENQRILELPLNGRNPVELIQLAGAAVPAGKNGTAGMPGGLNISIGGGLLSGVGYFLDGTLYNNPLYLAATWLRRICSLRLSVSPRTFWTPSREVWTILPNPLRSVTRSCSVPRR